MYIMSRAIKTIRVKKECVARFEVDLVRPELGPLEQPQRRRGRWDLFDSFVLSTNKERRMTRAHDPGATVRRIERNAHRRHESACSEDAAKIAIHGAHDLGRFGVLNRAVVKQ